MQLTGHDMHGLFVICVDHQTVSEWTVSDKPNSVKTSGWLIHSLLGGGVSWR